MEQWGQFDRTELRAPKLSLVSDFGASLWIAVLFSSLLFISCLILLKASLLILRAASRGSFSLHLIWKPLLLSMGAGQSSLGAAEPSRQSQAVLLLLQLGLWALCAQCCWRFPISNTSPSSGCFNPRCTVQQSGFLISLFCCAWNKTAAPH